MGNDKLKFVGRATRRANVMCHCYIAQYYDALSSGAVSSDLLAIFAPLSGCCRSYSPAPAQRIGPLLQLTATESRPLWRELDPKVSRWSLRLNLHPRHDYLLRSLAR